MKLKETMGLMVLSSMAMAQSAGMVIPPDQPLCKLYSLIQLFGTLGAVIAACYAGFKMATSHEQTERTNCKALIEGALLGLIIIWIAPFVVQYLVSSSNICGW